MLSSLRRSLPSFRNIRPSNATNLIAISQQNYNRNAARMINIEKLTKFVDTSIQKDICITDPLEQEKYVTDERSGKLGSTPAVLLPQTTQDLKQLLTYCDRNGIKVIQQGGISGLSQTSIPLNAEVIISMARFNKADINIDPDAKTMTLSACHTIDDINKKASEHKLFFPINIGGKNAHIGGMIANNAAGTLACRYGSTGERTTKFTVMHVNGDEEEITVDPKSLKGVNGTLGAGGYIGSGGYLGVITKATIQLADEPNQTSQMLLVATNPSDITKIRDALSNYLEKIGEQTSAFETTPLHLLNLVAGSSLFTQGEDGVTENDYTVLIQVDSTRTDNISLESELIDIAGNLWDKGLIKAMRSGKGNELMAIRENISSTVKRLGTVLAFDIAIEDRDDLPRFLEESEVAAKNIVENMSPGTEIKTAFYGHFELSATHMNFYFPNRDLTDEIATAIRDEIYQKAANHNGVVSAEHGIGPATAPYYVKHTDEKIQMAVQEKKNEVDPNCTFGHATQRAIDKAVNKSLGNLGKTDEILPPTPATSYRR